MEEKAVADASVVAKWFLEEPFSEQSRRLRDAFVTGKIVLCVPSLLPYEVMNALWRSGQFNEEELVLLARAVSKYGFEIWEESGELIEGTAALAAREGVSVFDAAYIALARQIGVKVLTADSEMIRRFSDTAIHVNEYMRR